MPPNISPGSVPAAPGSLGVITRYFMTDSSHGGVGSGGQVVANRDPATNVDLDHSGLNDDVGDIPADGMDTSPSPRRRRRSTEGSMTTNTSANPLVSPPQRIRLDQPEDNVFHDVPPSAPSSPTGVTIDHLAEMIREQRTDIRTEIRGMEGRMEGRMEERESRMMGALDSRINVL